MSVSGLGFVLSCGVDINDGSSSVMTRVASVVWRRTIRFRVVTRLLPSTSTLYCRYGRRSIIFPVASQRSGWLPRWFWILTTSPGDNGSNDRRRWYLVACSFLLTYVISRMSASSDHSSLIRTGFNMWSRKGRPNRSSAGDTPMSWGGVLRCSRRAFVTESVSSDPDGLILVVRIRFMVLTALSARPLLCGK